MAYFANGTEGMMLDEQCEGCLYGMNDDVLCPVSAVQNIFNYEQCDNPKLAEAMNLLIGQDGYCKMKKAMAEAGLSFDCSHKEQASFDL